MPDIPIAGYDENRLFQQFLGHYDVPAYVRRARRVQEALEDLLAACRTQREQWLSLVRVRLGVLRALAGEWTVLRPYLTDNRQCAILEDLHRVLAPQLRGHVEATTSERILRRALSELCASLERFNRQWREFLFQINLKPVNDQREGYNRYYVLEKECAVRSPILARRGFVPLAPITVADIAAVLPELSVPKVKR